MRRTAAGSGSGGVFPPVERFFQFCLLGMLASGLLALVWLGLAGRQAAVIALTPQRPALAQVASRLGEVLQDGDAVIVLPTFSHCDAMGFYLSGELGSDGEEAGWMRVERVDHSQIRVFGPITDLPTRPIETRLGGLYRRLVVVSVEEQMCGRPRFNHAAIRDHVLQRMSADYQEVEALHFSKVEVHILERRGPIPGWFQ